MAINNWFHKKSAQSWGLIKFQVLSPQRVKYVKLLTCTASEWLPYAALCSGVYPSESRTLINAASESIISFSMSNLLCSAAHRIRTSGLSEK